MSKTITDTERLDWVFKNLVNDGSAETWTRDVVDVEIKADNSADARRLDWLMKFPALAQYGLTSRHVIDGVMENENA